MIERRDKYNLVTPNSNDDIWLNGALMIIPQLYAHIVTDTKLSIREVAGVLSKAMEIFFQEDDDGDFEELEVIFAELLGHYLLIYDGKRGEKPYRGVNFELMDYLTPATIGIRQYHKVRLNISKLLAVILSTNTGLPFIPVPPVDEEEYNANNEPVTLESASGQFTTTYFGWSKTYFEDKPIIPSMTGIVVSKPDIANNDLFKNVIRAMGTFNILHEKNGVDSLAHSFRILEHFFDIKKEANEEIAVIVAPDINSSASNLNLLSHRVIEVNFSDYLAAFLNFYTDANFASATE